LQRRGGSEKAPLTLLWHHDDMLLNFTSVIQFMKDERKYFGAMPIHCNTEDYPEVKGPRTLATEKEAEKYLKSDDYTPQPCQWMPGVRPILQQLLKEGKFFTEVGSECHKVYAARGYNVTDPSRFTTKMLSDMIMVKWSHPRLVNFHKKLKILAGHGMMLEYAIPLAFRCSLSSDEIDQNYSWLNFCETSYWNNKRNDPATMELSMKSRSQDLYHPHKIAFSIQHLDAALKWRTKTMSILNENQKPGPLSRT